MARVVSKQIFDNMMITVPGNAKVLGCDLHAYTGPVVYILEYPEQVTYKQFKFRLITEGQYIDDILEYEMVGFIRRMPTDPPMIVLLMKDS